MGEFDIIEFVSGLTPFVFDKSTLKRVIFERGASEVESFDDLTVEQKELMKADLLYAVYTSPTIWASSSQKHGNFEMTIGSQTIYANDKDKLFGIFSLIYKKYDKEKYEEVKDLNSNLQWLDI